MTWTSRKVRSSQRQVCHRTVPTHVLVRTTRARIVCLRNDYKALMSKIEAGLHTHHASIRSSSGSTALDPSHESREGPSSTIRTPHAPEAPFAKVNSVAAGSPANDAGLRAGDKIRAFGTANWMNHEKLSKVAEVVQQSEGVCSKSFAQGSSLTILPAQCHC